MNPTPPLPSPCTAIPWGGRESKQNEHLFVIGYPCGNADNKGVRMADEDRYEAARNAILDRVVNIAPSITSSTSLLALAEAFAWASMPGQPHGSKAGSQ